jgi:hypothetical protein
MKHEETKRNEEVALEIGYNIHLLLQAEEEEETSAARVAMRYPVIGQVEIHRSFFDEEEKTWPVTIRFEGKRYGFAFTRDYASTASKERTEKELKRYLKSTQYYGDVLNLLTNFKVK